MSNEKWEKRKKKEEKKREKGNQKSFEKGKNISSPLNGNEDQINECSGKAIELLRLCTVYSVFCILYSIFCIMCIYWCVCIDRRDKTIITH